MKLKQALYKLSASQRLYELEVPVMGLTGGIASGKSTVGRVLLNQGYPVINADLLVKDVYALPETKAYLEANHPSVIEKGLVNFPLLRQLVFSDKTIKSEIEKFIYAKLPQAFMNSFHQIQDPKFVIYDVPLLFEKNMDALFDLKVLVYAPRKVQLARLMTRDGHDELMAKNILDQQMDIEEKKSKSDFVISNVGTEEELAESLKRFIHQHFEN